MAVFRRFASTEAKKKLHEFFTYHTTKSTLKPWIYRPKNANILLTMDLKDPATNAPLKPREPIQPLSRKVLDQYIASVEPGSRELVEWFKLWTNVSPRKRALWNYLSSEHLQNMLMQSFFRIGSYAGLVRTLYCNKENFLKAHNINALDVEHFFNTILVCNLHRNRALGFNDPLVAQKKLVNAWANVTLRKNESGLTNSLIQALAKQQNIKSIPELSGLKAATVSLPELPLEESQGKMAAQLGEFKFLYLTARTIAEFDPETDAAIHDFIKRYQSYLQNLGAKDIYESSVEDLERLLATRQANNETTTDNQDSVSNAEFTEQSPPAHT
ncbi:MRP13 (YGR084C) [Zygosaccharomyces parabailii]|uniref:ZYBA0S04-10352g1_1 n=1 Tax=Zygosaccharomyces bailii (strain CLIB 213 / ATCC 58445 / CBS 680 / BCRC 21525 / NBRC 1098 / NCYC 1416 / NRRL Y-2227) TaxID=1333698 RepID=A0A8J2XAU9_ZYGB2|nr:MRP13 (YGR084C) [Zygosaccharomyces parabailii]CDF89692.1 ZYBA0S04-10352g1_1 [Zygosaccharomyces bailii CLIB 213]CDH13815.1 related to 37S ribosomal protein MRP13,mitochondrial [Zygosaccharomyces bailii ISA1307]SJM87562.1 related to 37S ribosomal protein MRP13, mitochondrial [Zygosaccharomyces bailii]